MQLISIRSLSGPSVLHDRPLLKATLDIGDLEQSDTSTLPCFVDRLLSVVPELWDHRCSPGYPGGFVERLRRGTWMAHVVEHVALALSDRAGISVGYGKNEHGKLYYRFGPLLYEGGERRLNVAVTRARKRMTLVSSFDHTDMDPDRSSGTS